MKKIMIMICFCMVSLLSGCDVAVEHTMRNIEERDYATVLMIQRDGEKKYHMVLGVAKAKLPGEKSEGEVFSSFDCDGLDELKEKYEARKGKSLCLAHLKVILLTKVCPLEGSGECIKELGYNKEIAKTVPVIEIEKPKTFLWYMKEMDEPFGTYMSNLINAEERKGKKIPWLKDYLKNLQEGENIIIYDALIEEEGVRLFAKKEEYGF